MIILFFLLLVGTLALLIFDKQDSSIFLFEATAVPTSDDNQMFMAGLKIKNNGDPDRLIAVSSPSAKSVVIMNPGHEKANIIIPANGSSILAMDGAHIMLMTTPGTFEQGAFIPLNLIFENAGTVSIRVKNTGVTTMNHGKSNGVSEDPAPELSLSWKTPPKKNGATVQLDTRNFTFLRAKDDAVHLPNEGHAHVYLNGLKLGRLYEKTYVVGPLSPGSYALSVALNSNRHRPYLNEGAIVESTLVFEIPK